MALLTQARLVRVNRATDDLEPSLAESWTTSADGRTFTLKLRQAVFSDGVPFTADDVLFSFAAVYDAKVQQSPLRHALIVDGQPLEVSAPDPSTVVDPLSRGRSRPGCGSSTTCRSCRSTSSPPRSPRERSPTSGRRRGRSTPIAGLGPFVLTEHVSGPAAVFPRNPHYFRRDAAGIQLPYLDELTLVVIADQNAEALRLQAGEIDLMANGEIRAAGLRGLQAARSPTAASACTVSA